SRCFDPQEDGTSANDELVRLLDKMAKTFTTLEVVPLGQLALAIAEACRALAAGSLQKSGAVAMALAQGLLQIEGAAREIPYGSSGWRLGVDEQCRVLANLASVPDTSGMEVSEAPLSAQDRRQLVGAVAGEIRANLARIEEAFLAFVASPRDRDGLAGIPSLAAQVEAAFRVLEEEAAAGLARSLHGVLSQLAQGGISPEGAVAEAVAAGVAGLEAHVNGLERGRPLRPIELADLARPLDGALGGRVAAREGRVEGAPAHAVAGPSLSVADLAIDPEILPVFLEDAHQAVAQLEESLPVWGADLSNESAVGVARRAFHTLKGSGRMVEAGEIAELSYDAESLLNKIRARDRVSDAQVLAWIVRAYEAVRDWVQAVEQGHRLPEMATIREALQALVAGREPRPFEAQAPAMDAEPVLPEGLVPIPAFEDQGSQESLEAVTLPGDANLFPEGAARFPQETFEAVSIPEDAAPIPEDVASEPQALSSEAATGHSDGIPLVLADPLLRDIFAAETRDHLRVLRAAISEGLDRAVSAHLLRAAHTMQGSARSVALVAMAESCAGVEHYLQAREIEQKPLGAEGVDLLTGLATATEGLLAALDSGTDPAAPFVELSAYLAVRAREDMPAPGLTWWQKNLALAEGPREAPTEAGEPASPPEAWAPAPDVMGSISDVREETVVSAPVREDVGAPADEAIDPELRDIFRDEARDLLDGFEAALAQWRVHRERSDQLDSLKRVLHTLKGGARMCGALRMGDLAHATEDLLRRVEEGSYPRDEALFALLDSAAEHLGELYKAFISGRSTLDGSRERTLLAQLQGKPVASEPAESAQEWVPEATPAPVFAPTAATTDSPPANDPAEDLF
ncbi:MAG: Hpt domain-containing protein, partial [Acidiferrobacter sp.]